MQKTVFAETDAAKKKSLWRGTPKAYKEEEKDFKCSARGKAKQLRM